MPLPLARVSPRRLPPLLVLAASLALTAAATTVVAVTGRAREGARFENAADLTRARIENRTRTVTEGETDIDFNRMPLTFDLVVTGNKGAFLETVASLQVEQEVQA